MAKSKLILISGGPCVGKSTVARKIFEHYENSALCDGDWCWCVNPLSLEDTRLRNGDVNMAFLLSNYLNSGFEKVVFSSVVLTDAEARENILRNITAKDYEIISFQLDCSEDTLRERHIAAGGSEAVSFFWLKLPPYPGEYEINTDDKSADMVCEEICKIIDTKKSAAKKPADKNTAKAVAKKTASKPASDKAAAKKTASGPKAATGKSAAKKQPAKAATGKKTNQ